MYKKRKKRLNEDSSFFLAHTSMSDDAPVKMAFKCFIVPITCMSIYEENCKANKDHFVPCLYACPQCRPLSACISSCCTTTVILH